MCRSPYAALETPALLVDREIMLANLRDMQGKADAFGVALRPHTKTHKMPELARLQVRLGARGITVAKLGEAEVMAEHGLDDIFIANQVVGAAKLERLRQLYRRIRIRLGVDHPSQVDQLEAAFAAEARPIEVLIELEVGEERAGVITDEQLAGLARHTLGKRRVALRGVFCHEGHTYKARDAAHCAELALAGQRRALAAAALLRELGADLDTVSVGATPALMHAGVLAGITEIRPGTYIFMDAGQAHALGSLDRCAATVLSTVVSKPTPERVVIDAGAKSLTTQHRGEGICHTPGLGLVKHSSDVRLSGLFDEHGLISNRDFRERVEIGDKIEVIPNHICPVCNLYDTAQLVSGGELVQEIPILCRGRLQ